MGRALRRTVPLIGILILAAGRGGSTSSGQLPTTSCPDPFLTAPSNNPRTRIEGSTTTGAGCVARNR